MEWVMTLNERSNETTVRACAGGGFQIPPTLAALNEALLSAAE